MLLSLRKRKFIVILGLSALAFFLSAEPPSGWAQCSSCSGGAVNVFGSHSNGGRSCAVCHVPNAQYLSHAREKAFNEGLWSADANPERDTTVDKAHVLITKEHAAITAEVSEVLLCLSCHDGNVAKENMTANQSYEEFASGGNQARKAIPTMRDREGWMRSPDHPLGPDAVIKLGHGLQFANGKFSVAPGSPYAQFVANYGWPTLAPTGRVRRYGVTADGKPYLLCTTCHNQHGTDEYTSTAQSPIADDGGGNHYVALYSLNGPYNPDIHNPDGRMTTSNVQFCRQCHFELSNEANNTYGVHTLF